MTDTAVLHEKYRPTQFKDVLGQDVAVGVLKRVIERDASHAFLLTGPAGTGKTTLARICATQLGCHVKDITEINGAKYTGVDDMRSVTDLVQYKPFGKSKVRVVIVDECHRLSQQAWDSLLKATEEPPSYVYWFLCSTMPNKIPTTIKTRCTKVQLKPVTDDLLQDLINDVSAEEGFKVPDDIKAMIITEARGSARQALVNLTSCIGVKDKKEAAEILKAAVSSDAIIELCQFLVQAHHGSWMKVMAILTKLEDTNPETVRIIVVNYVTAVIKNLKSEKGVGQLLDILDVFSTPFNDSDKMAPLILAVGRLLMGS